MDISANDAIDRHPGTTLESFRFRCRHVMAAPFRPQTQVLGRGLKDLPRDQIIVATKVGRYGPEEFDFSAERVTRSVHDSLRRLQLDYVDLIQAHDVEFVSLDVVGDRTAACGTSAWAVGAPQRAFLPGNPPDNHWSWQPLR